MFRISDEHFGHQRPFKMGTGERFGMDIQVLLQKVGVENNGSTSWRVFKRFKMFWQGRTRRSPQSRSDETILQKNRSTTENFREWIFQVHNPAFTRWRQQMNIFARRRIFGVARHADQFERNFLNLRRPSSRKSRRHQMSRWRTATVQKQLTNIFPKRSDNRLYSSSAGDEVVIRCRPDDFDARLGWRRIRACSAVHE